MPRPARLALDFGIPVLIACSFGVLMLTPDLRRCSSLPAVAAVVVALLGVPLLLGKRHAPRWGAAAVLIGATLLRLAFVFRAPELSDDIYRYLWDGHTALVGRSPYAAPPAAVAGETPAWEAIRARVNHPELVTIYPPAAQRLFEVGAFLGGGPTGMKALFCLLDLGACVILLRLLQRAGLPPWMASLYAWHPLVVLEVAASGHIDGPAVFWMLLSWSLLVQQGGKGKALAAGAAFVLAVGTKVVPILLLPFLFTIARGRRRAFGVGAVLAAVGTCGPFYPGIRNSLGTWMAYGRHWEFEGFAFRTLRGATGSGDIARLVLAVLLVLSVTALWVARRKNASAPRSAYGAFLAFLLLTPTLHPWYALYLVAFLPMAAEPAGLYISAAILLGYRVVARYAVTGLWIESAGVAAAIFIPPAVWLMWLRVRSHAEWRSLLGPIRRPWR